jgi:hypothetical protein
MEQSLLEKITVAQLAKKSHAFHETQRLITAFIKARFWTLS